VHRLAVTQALSPEQVEEAKLRARYGGLMPKKKSSGLLPLSRKVRGRAAAAPPSEPVFWGRCVALVQELRAVAAAKLTRASRPRRAGGAGLL
jgi:hypothetical protein